MANVNGQTAAPVPFALADQPQVRVRRAIVTLVGIHLVGGLVATLYLWTHLSDWKAPFISLIFCQASLVGTWLALGVNDRLFKISIASAASVYLAVVLLGLSSIDAAWDVYFYLFFVVPVSVFGTGALTWIAHVACRTAGKMTTERAKLQFTVFHLMTLTLAVAAFATVGGLLAPHFDPIDLTILVLAICFVSVGVATIWAWLGLSDAILRVVLVFLVAATAGWVESIAFPPAGVGFWMQVSMLQAIFLVASLEVVRRVAGRCLVE